LLFNVCLLEHPWGIVVALSLVIVGAVSFSSLGTYSLMQGIPHHLIDIVDPYQGLSFYKNLIHPLLIVLVFDKVCRSCVISWFSGCAPRDNFFMWLPSIAWTDYVMLSLIWVCHLISVYAYSFGSLHYLNSSGRLLLQTTPLDIFLMMLGQPRDWYCQKGLYPLLLGEQACIYAGKLFEFAHSRLHIGVSCFLVGLCLLRSSSVCM